MDKHFAFVGSWSLKDEPLGLSVYSYDPDTAQMELMETVLEEVCVSEQLLDEGKGILYITDETYKPRAGVRNGRIIGLRIDEKSGRVSEFTCADTLLPKPSYLAMTHDKKWMLASIHSNVDGANQVARSSDGSLALHIIPNDAGLALFPVSENGELGQIRDLYVTTDADRESHMHCVNANPGEKVFICCDKGGDAIDVFSLDKEAGRLKLLKSNEMSKGLAPRFVAFHPNGRFFLQMNEHCMDLFSFGYDTETGEIRLIDREPILEEGKSERSVSGAEAGNSSQKENMVLKENTAQKENIAQIGNSPRKGNMPLGLCMSADGKTAYVSVRDANRIAVFAVEEEGGLHRIQVISCGGENPRGLCLAPDGRFLLCGNTGSDRIVAFPVNADGSLGEGKKVATARMPANMTIL